jgi:catechol 2,3-dioxygenase-like lactoylglutathione lyase family enzyme
VLHHASLEIRRDGADAEVAFWALLGYPEIPALTESLAARSRWLQDRGPSRHQIHLVYEDDPTILRRAHLAIVRDDYDATLAALRAAGFDVVDREPYWDSPRAFVHSPAGHRIEVMAFAPRD